MTKHRDKGPVNHWPAAVIAAATVIVLAGIGALFALTSDGSNDTSVRDRQAVVEARGVHVMPFDQSQTTHVFEKTVDGGTQTVTANDPTDATHIALVRMHLEHEARLFASGDFHDPAAIHGAHMPGLAELERGSSELRIEYRDAPRGATITFRTTKAKLAVALHAWFDAQLADHARMPRVTSVSDARHQPQRIGCTASA